jgi:hypothetical protein
MAVEFATAGYNESVEYDWFKRTCKGISSFSYIKTCTRVRCIHRSCVYDWLKRTHFTFCNNKIPKTVHKERLGFCIRTVEDGCKVA